jgi:carboxyl-terminal processing protease
MSRASRLGSLVSLVVLGLGCSGLRDPPPPTSSAAKVAAVPDETPKPIAGIGIRPVSHADGFAIGQLFPGGAAADAGLREGDVVVEVDGDRTARWTLDRTASRLRGEAGTDVTLVAQRDGERFEVRLTRRTLAVP